MPGETEMKTSQGSSYGLRLQRRQSVVVLIGRAVGRGQRILGGEVDDDVKDMDPESGTGTSTSAVGGALGISSPTGAEGSAA